MTDTSMPGEGKTKSVVPVPMNPAVAVMTAKDIVSWKNKHQEVMEGKAAWSTTTAANMFRILDHHQIPNAFIEQMSPTEMLVDTCIMAPFEVVIRFGIGPESSMLKRNPAMPLGPLPMPVVEFFLKTKGTTFKGIEVPDDDPFISYRDDAGIRVHKADKPSRGKGKLIPVEMLLDSNVVGSLSLSMLFEVMEQSLLDAGILLKETWDAEGWDLGDFKAEFGWTLEGRLIIADVIDNDSWRIKDPDGIERSKQVIRDGKSVKDAASDFAMVAEASDRVWAAVLDA
ncbi:MAG: phosphoribosylaminoimidazolesuccinocarboxamide synthase [Patescibacteria group bacterium]